MSCGLFVNGKKSTEISVNGDVLIYTHQLLSAGVYATWFTYTMALCFFSLFS